MCDHLLIQKYFHSKITGINTKNLQLSTHIQMIDVIKDFNLNNDEGKDDPYLTHLKLLHLVGPFGPEVTSYIIKGATLIEDLCLGIDWMTPHFCSIQPNSEKDFIGIEYLKEMIKVNTLPNLHQLHLSGLDDVSRAYLDKDCLNFVLNTFGSTLKHFGNFFKWNLSTLDRWVTADRMTSQNCAIILEEHLKNIKDEKVDLQKKYVEDRKSYSCQDPNSLVFQQYNSIRIVYDSNGNVTDITATDDDLSDSEFSVDSLDEWMNQELMPDNAIFQGLYNFLNMEDD